MSGIAISSTCEYISDMYNHEIKSQHLATNFRTASISNIEENNEIK